MSDSVERPAVIAVLTSSALLRKLGDAALEELAAASRAWSAERGECIWYRGDDISYFGVVGTGFVKMVRGTVHGQEVTVEIMGPGQAFGMLAAIEGSGCPLTAQAVSDTYYVKVPRSAFLPIYQSRTELRDALVSKTTGRLVHAHDMMARLSTGSVEERMAAVLLVLANSYGRQEDGATHIDVPLTRQDIAEMACTTVESAIRTMSRWQKAGAIETENRHVTILDKAAILGCLE